MKFRHEYKHQVNTADLMELRARLGVLLQRDVHAQADGTYMVKSLYFDNYMDKALREKCDGVSKREKFRIRYYGNDTTFIRLEKKSKIQGLCHKEQAPLEAEEVQKILDGDIKFLRNSEHDLLKELYAKMRYQLLRPKSIVVYRRESFVYPMGNVRITLDTQISGSNHVRAFLNPDLSYVPLCTNGILEVKWDAYLPRFILDAVQMGNRKAAAFSKYAATRY